MDTNEPESDKVDRSLCFAKSRDCGRVRCVLALLSVGGCSQKRLAFLCRSCVISGTFAQTRQSNRSAGAQDAPGAQAPDVIGLIGPVRQDQDLRSLPYVPQAGEVEHRRLTRYPRPDTQPSEDYGTSKFPQFQSLLKNIFRPTPTMPPPLLTFDGINSGQSFCGCFPPDTNGDVGPNHYVETTNVAIKIFDKNGNT